MKLDTTFARWLVVAACLTAATRGIGAGSLTPPGPPGPSMKSLDEIEPRIPISSLPFDITQAGSYYLTKTLTGAAGQHGIRITVSHVTLDLGGFALVGVAQSLNGVVVAPFSGSLFNIVVRRGTVRNWGESGVDASAAVHGQFQSLHLQGNGTNGLHAGAGAVVQDCTAYENGAGIVAGTGCAITRCTSSRNSTDGINADADCAISHCVCVGNGDDGVQLGAGARIEHCAASGNGVFGFSLVGNGATIRDCAARSNQDGFFLAGNGTAIKDCAARSNRERGIRMNGNNCQASGNVCDDNDVGILAVGSGNRIEANHTAENRRTGIWVNLPNGHNLVVKNSGRNNVGLTSGNPDRNYKIATGNMSGPIIRDFVFGDPPSLADTYPQNHPWANFGDPLNP